jgi:hypothetical protein
MPTTVLATPAEADTSGFLDLLGDANLLTGQLEHAYGRHRRAIRHYRTAVVLRRIMHGAWAVVTMVGFFFVCSALRCRSRAASPVGTFRPWGRFARGDVSLADFLRARLVLPQEAVSVWRSSVTSIWMHSADPRRHDQQHAHATIVSDWITRCYARAPAHERAIRKLEHQVRYTDHDVARCRNEDRLRWSAARAISNLAGFTLWHTIEAQSLLSASGEGDVGRGGGGGDKGDCNRGDKGDCKRDQATGDCIGRFPGAAPWIGVLERVAGDEVARRPKRIRSMYVARLIRLAMRHLERTSWRCFTVSSVTELDRPDAVRAISLALTPEAYAATVAAPPAEQAAIVTATDNRAMALVRAEHRGAGGLVVAALGCVHAQRARPAKQPYGWRDAIGHLRTALELLWRGDERRETTLALAESSFHLLDALYACKAWREMHRLLPRLRLAALRLERLEHVELVARRQRDAVDAHARDVADPRSFLASINASGVATVRSIGATRRAASPVGLLRSPADRERGPFTLADDSDASAQTPPTQSSASLATPSSSATAALSSATATTTTTTTTITTTATITAENERRHLAVVVRRLAAYRIAAAWAVWCHSRSPQLTHERVVAETQRVVPKTLDTLAILVAAADADQRQLCNCTRHSPVLAFARRSLGRTGRRQFAAAPASGLE